MTGYGIETEVVHSAGTNIHGLGPDVFTKANNVLLSLDDACGIVHHPAVAGALGAFCADHAGDPHALKNAVEACGGNIATTATICVDGENESTAAHGVAAGQGEQTRSALNFQI